METKLVVIGAGPGGYGAAVRAAQLGAQVSIVEKENVGGTCLNWGCIPSKIMKTAAETLERVQRARQLGLCMDGALLPDMDALMARKQSVVESQSQGIHKILEHHKIRFFQGTAVINAPNKLTVQFAQGEPTKLDWDRLILATGSSPLALPFLPFDGEQVLSSNDVVSLQKVPDSVLIVGGGVIGCEFASILAALGSKVTVVEAMERLLPLPTVDEDCSKTLQREMKKQKIRTMVHRTVQKVEKKDGRLAVTIIPSQEQADTKGRSQKPQTENVQQVIICIGRTPNTAGIGLENIGVDLDSQGWILADARMATSAAGVYAVGDVLGPSRIMLAHVASTEGFVAAENALGGNRTMGYGVVPSAIFTMPEVATVGLTEAQAIEQGHPVRTESVLFRNLGKAQVLGEIGGQAKIVFHSENGKILGVHLVGPHAADLIAEGTLAIEAGLTVEDVAKTIHAHPTLAEIMQEGAFKAVGTPLHG
jgi:dihydrolipoamide dehydrogenase